MLITIRAYRVNREEGKEGGKSEILTFNTLQLSPLVLLRLQNIYSIYL